MICGLCPVYYWAPRETRVVCVVPLAESRRADEAFPAPSLSATAGLPPPLLLCFVPSSLHFPTVSLSSLLNLNRAVSQIQFEKLALLLVRSLASRTFPSVVAFLGRRSPPFSSFDGNDFFFSFPLLHRRRPRLDCLPVSLPPSAPSLRPTAGPSVWSENEEPFISSPSPPPSVVNPQSARRVIRATQALLCLAFPPFLPPSRHPFLPFFIVSTTMSFSASCSRSVGRSVGWSAGLSTFFPFLLRLHGIQPSDLEG